MLFHRIPVSVQPFFWVLAALIGWLYGRSFVGMLIWMVIIFVSVLIHEYGHALTALWFRQKPSIQLTAFGGLTSYKNGPPLRLWQQFFIVLNGPLFGLALGFLSWMVFHWVSIPLLRSALQATFLANLFWSIVNLLPALPLDGGQLVRILLEGAFGAKGFRLSLLFSALFAGTVACIAFVFQYIIAGAFFFLFAFQSLDAWRKAKFTTNEDRSEENFSLLEKAEKAWEEGEHQTAKALFEQICQKSSAGVLYTAASQYLALLAMQEGNKEEAYRRLLEVKGQLAEQGLCLLHELAFERKNDGLVAELSSSCYQIIPSRDVALRNARSFARLNKPAEAGGWLQTAWQHEKFPLERVLSEKDFSSMKENPVFQEFIDPLRG